MNSKEEESNNITASNMTRSIKSTSREFSEPFRAGLYYTWGVQGEPSAKKFFNSLAKEDRYDDFSTQYITEQQLRTMVSNWQSKAHIDDRLIREELQNKIVSDRVEMIQRHLPIITGLIKDASQHLKEKGFGSSRNALTAILQLMPMEARLRGIPIKEYENISNLDEAQIINLFERLAQEGLLNDSQDTQGALQATRVAKPPSGGGSS